MSLPWARRYEKGRDGVSTDMDSGFLSQSQHGRVGTDGGWSALHICGAIANMHIYFQPPPLFHTVVMLVVPVGGGRTDSALNSATTYKRAATIRSPFVISVSPWRKLVTTATTTAGSATPATMSSAATVATSAASAATARSATTTAWTSSATWPSVAAGTIPATIG